MARQAKQVTLTGAVYCDWNAFSFVAPLPDKRYWVPGDLVIWSWSGDSSAPSSRATGGTFAVSVIVGKRRRRLKVKRTRVHRKLPFGSDTGREVQLTALVQELRALKGRQIIKSRWGFEVTLQESAVPADRSPPTTSTDASQAPTVPHSISAPHSTTTLRNTPVAPATMVAAGESPRRPQTVPADTFSRPRGRIKPGIRSDVPEPAVVDSLPEPAARAVVPVVAVVVSIQLLAPKKRRRKKSVNPNQGVLL